MGNSAFRSASQLATLIRKGKLGSVEILEHYLERVERYNPTLNAIVVTDIAAARKRARAADRALRRGDLWGPLHGVPMTVKECFDIVGLPTTLGAERFRDNRATRNATAVDRLLGAGAIIFGKTNLPVMMADWQSFNPLYGRTNNPWDETRVPGGSSGGSAAALAAGLTGLELGSDIGGSIRGPAHYCGVYGHKPTTGICPSQGSGVPGLLASADMAVIGPMGRSATDLALGLEIIAGSEGTQALGWRLSLPVDERKSLKDFKVGVLFTSATAEVDEAVQGRLQELATFLGQRKVRVREACPEIDQQEAHALFIRLVRGATSRNLDDSVVAEHLKARSKLRADDQGYRAWMLRGNTQTHREWLIAHEARTRMAAQWEQYFEDYDLLICPAAASTAFEHNPEGERWERMLPVNGGLQPSTTQMFWAGYSGLAGLPSTVVPLGRAADDLPVGAQLIGRRFGDLTCLRFARLLEKEYQAFEAPPGYP